MLDGVGLERLTWSVRIIAAPLLEQLVRCGWRIYHDDGLTQNIVRHDIAIDLAPLGVDLIDVARWTLKEIANDRKTSRTRGKWEV